jgi:hypothetical protein
MTQAIRCVGLSLGLIDSRSGSPEVNPPDATVLRGLSPVIESRRGVLAEQPGVVCALFRDVDSAVECAVAIFEKLDALETSSPAPAALVARIAIESGEIELDGRQLGGALHDTLTVLQTHTPNLSIVIGRNAALALDVGWASRTRPLMQGALQSNGFAGLEAHELDALSGAVEMPWRVDATTHQEATVVADLNDAENGGLFSAIELIVAGVARRLSPSDCPYSIGRDTRCNLVLSCAEASRLHATITYDQSRFYYVDSSRNGSYLLTSSGEELFVHQERHWLVGRGAISPGTPVMNQTGELIRFICEPARLGEPRYVGVAVMGGLIPEPGTTVRR